MMVNIIISINLHTIHIFAIIITNVMMMMMKIMSKIIDFMIRQWRTVGGL